MSFFVYILYSEKYDRFYIGRSQDLEKRLERHNRGYVKSTKSYRPWTQLYYETFPARSEAVKREADRYYNSI